MDKYRKLFNLFSKKQLKVLLLIGILTSISAILEAFGIGLIFPILDLFSNQNSISQTPYLLKIYNALNFGNETLFIKFFFLACGAFFILKNLYFLLIIYIQKIYFANRRDELHDLFYNYYMEAPYSFHLKNNSVTLMRNINEVGGIFQYLIQPISVIITEFLTIFCIFAFLFYTSPIASIASFCLITIFTYLINILLKSKLIKYGDEKVNSIEIYNKVFFEGLHGIKEIKVLNRENYYKQEYSSSFKKFNRTLVNIDFLYQIPRAAMESFIFAGLMSYLFFQYATTGNASAIGTSIIVFCAALIKLMPSVNKITASINIINSSKASIDIVINELKRLNAKDSSPSQDQSHTKAANKKDSKVIHFNDSIELCNLNFDYGHDNSTPVLRNLNISIKKNQSIGIVGPSGSGKSTLVNILLGLLEPTSGQILVDKKNIFSNIKSWRNSIGNVSQSIFSSDDTLRKNIALGISDTDIQDEKLFHALNMAKLKEVIDHLPQGVETKIGERGSRLSGGQMQRVGIARALYHSPEVLIFDEATSSLDTIMEKEVISAIEGLKGKKTLISIAHRIKTVENCDMIYFLKDGRIHAKGTYQELLNNSDDFKKLVGTKVKSEKLCKQ